MPLRFFRLTVTAGQGASPLRVQGGARGILAARHPAQPLPNPEKQAGRLALFIAGRQSPPPGVTELHKASRTACAIPGQGAMPLAGAGRSPRSSCRQAIPADRRNPNPEKQAERLALFIAARQSPPSGGHTLSAKIEPAPLASCPRERGS